MGVRSLCNGIGPALFGVFFFLFDVNLSYNEETLLSTSDGDFITNNSTFPPNNDLNSNVSKLYLKATVRYSRARAKKKKLNSNL